jgi:hypothetical protein
VIIVLKRSHFPSEFMKFKTHNELKSGHKIMAVRFDNAGENKTLGKELSMLGVAVEYTTAYTPSQNGVAKRLNRTLVGMAKAMLLASGLPQKFWGFAIETACYIRNRLPISYRKMTLEEAFTGKKPDISQSASFWLLSLRSKTTGITAQVGSKFIQDCFCGLRRVYQSVSTLRSCTQLDYPEPQH